jgi:hypothetical protein
MRTTYQSDKILNHAYRNVAWTSPTAVYAGLLTAVTNAEAGTVTETAYGGYARQAITFGAPGAGTPGRKIDAGVLTYPAKSDAGSVTVIAFGCYDALTVGNLTDVIYLFDGSPLAALVRDADVANNDILSPTHGLVADTQVRVEQFPGSPTLPPPLAEDTTYWVIATGLTADIYRLSATQGGAAIDITDEGRMLVHRLAPVIINQNDAPTFAANKLSLGDD